MGKAPPLEHGFDWDVLRELPEEEQKRLKRIVVEEVRSDEKHKKRAQRAAEHELGTALKGGRTRVTLASPGPEDVVERLLFTDPEDDFRTALDLDLYDAIVSRLPFELHRIAAARTLLPDLTLTELAERLHLEPARVKRDLAEVRKLMDESGDNPEAERRRVLELLGEGLSLREIERKTRVPRSTIARWSASTK